MKLRLQPRVLYAISHHHHHHHHQQQQQQQQQQQGMQLMTVC